MFRKSLLAAIVLSLTMAVPASAGTMQISGVQSFDTAGICPETSLATFTMTGTLVGCWYTDSANTKVNPSGTIQPTGTEHFVGCLNGEHVWDVLHHVHVHSEIRLAGRRDPRPMPPSNRERY